MVCNGAAVTNDGGTGMPIPVARGEQGKMVSGAGGREFNFRKGLSQHALRD